MYCPKCGYQYDENEFMFCAKCGFKSPFSANINSPENEDTQSEELNHDVKSTKVFPNSKEHSREQLTKIASKNIPRISKLEGKNKIKKIGCLTFIFFIVILLIVAYFVGNNGKSSNNSNLEKETTSATEKITTEELPKFTNSLVESGVPLDTAKTVYTSLKSLGFKIDDCKTKYDNDNWYLVTVDNYDLEINIKDINNYQIWLDDSSVELWENTTKFYTKADLDRYYITDDDKIKYDIFAEKIVEKCLNDPDSADFCPYDEMSYNKDGNIVSVSGTVTAKNTLGGLSTVDFVIEYEVTDSETLFGTAKYIQIESESEGTYTNIDNPFYS